MLPRGCRALRASFLRAGAFGVTHDNVKDVGNGLLVDAATLGALPAPALAHMATINFRHGYERHDYARAALLQSRADATDLVAGASRPYSGWVRSSTITGSSTPEGSARRLGQLDALPQDVELELEHLERLSADARVVVIGVEQYPASAFEPEQLERAEYRIDEPRLAVLGARVDRQLVGAIELGRRR